MRNDPTQTKACASLIIAIATMLAAASCGPKEPVYTDASPQKLERACQAVDEATGLKMTETDRAWCKGLMQAWYSETCVRTHRLTLPLGNGRIPSPPRSMQQRCLPPIYRATFKVWIFA